MSRIRNALIWLTEKFLHEATWSFVGPVTPEQVLHELTKESDPGRPHLYTLPKFASRKSFVAFVQGNCFDVRVRPIALFAPVFSSPWFFEGAVNDFGGGCKISGVYRMNSLPRAVFLLFFTILPLFLLVGIFGIGAAIVMAAAGSRPWSIVPEGAVFIAGPLGLMGFVWALVGLMAWFDKKTRALTREFLRGLCQS